MSGAVWLGDEVLAMVRGSCAAGINACANLLLDAARERAPVDTGALRESGRVNAGDLRASVCFGAPYAVIVHERGSKFLEQACNDGGLRARMLEALKGEVAL